MHFFEISFHRYFYESCDHYAPFIQLDLTMCLCYAHLLAVEIVFMKTDNDIECPRLRTFSKAINHT